MKIEERYREALERIATDYDADESLQLRNAIKIAVDTLAEPTVTEPSEPLCPKCKTEVEWVIPPIPGVKPFFQCQDPDCNWMSDDGIPPPASACHKCGTEHKTPGSLEQPSAYCPVQTVTMNAGSLAPKSAEGERCAWTYGDGTTCELFKAHHIHRHPEKGHVFVPPGPAPERKEQ